MGPLRLLTTSVPVMTPYPTILKVNVLIQIPHSDAHRLQCDLLLSTTSLFVWYLLVNRCPSVLNLLQAIKTFPCDWTGADLSRDQKGEG